MFKWKMDIFFNRQIYEYLFKFLCYIVTSLVNNHKFYYTEYLFRKARNIIYI